MMFYTIDTRIDVDLELFFDSILIQCCYKKRIVLPMIDKVIFFKSLTDKYL